MIDGKAYLLATCVSPLKIPYHHDGLLDYGIVIRSFFVPDSKASKAKRNGSTTCSRALDEAVVVEE